MKITTSNLARKVNGKLIGPEKSINGIFTFLNQANSGDVVVRHWVDGKGIEIAAKRGVSCVVTQDPRGNTIETAKKLEIPLIITPKIEVANAFAIKWAVKNFAEDAVRVVVTGTNGKSTTTHMIYNILKEAGFSTYTNTDAKSEFNTLIDPVVAKQIAEFKGKNGKNIKAIVVEVSEVQGWLDKLMKDHAYLMTSAVDPNVLVLTNVALDHIGLVNSIEETFNEIYGAMRALWSKSEYSNDALPSPTDHRALNHPTEKSYAILNLDDLLVRKMGEMVKNGKNSENIDTVKLLFYGSDATKTVKPELKLGSAGIYYRDNLFLKTEELPFKSNHFIQNTMAAIGACVALNIDFKSIKSAVLSYKPLERRFSVLGTYPLIIDDFAHNPEGIIATIKSAAKMCEGILYVVFAIRGSRGESINLLNAEAVAKGLKGVNYALVVTSSVEAVDDANTVKSYEKDVVLDTLKENGLECVFHEKLHAALDYTVESADKIDTLLLIGAQGMDPASEVLKKIYEN